MSWSKIKQDQKQDKSLSTPTLPFELVSCLSLSAAMLLVDTGVYIGTAADLNDREALVAASVTHVLSVDSVDPQPLLPADGKLFMKWIDVLDEAKSDLLSHMDACFVFIQEGVEGGGAALVHWWGSEAKSKKTSTTFSLLRVCRRVDSTLP